MYIELHDSKRKKASQLLEASAGDFFSEYIWKTAQKFLVVKIRPLHQMNAEEAESAKKHNENSREKENKIEKKEAKDEQRNNVHTYVLY